MAQVPNGDWLRKDLEIIRAEITELRMDMHNRFDQIETRLDDHSLTMKEHESKIGMLENRWRSVWSNGWKVLTAIIALLGVAVAWVKGGD